MRGLGDLERAEGTLPAKLELVEKEGENIDATADGRSAPSSERDRVCRVSFEDDANAPAEDPQDPPGANDDENKKEEGEWALVAIGVVVESETEEEEDGDKWDSWGVELARFSWLLCWSTFGM